MKQHNMKNEMQGNYFVYWPVLCVLTAGRASIVIQQMKLKRDPNWSIDQ